MAARTLLLKLERLGDIRLPARHSPGRPNRRGFAMPEVMAHDTTTVETDLSRLRPLQIECLDTGDALLSPSVFLVVLGHPDRVQDQVSRS